MKSDHVLIVIFTLMTVGGIIYFIKGFSVDIQRLFEGEESLHITFNPEQKIAWPDHVGIYISSESEPYQKLYNILMNYDRKWYKVDDMPVNSLVRLQGDILRLDIFKNHFYISGENKQGYFRSYRGWDEEGDLLFLLEYMEKE